MNNYLLWIACGTHTLLYNILCYLKQSLFNLNINNYELHAVIHDIDGSSCNTREAIQMLINCK